MTVFVLDTAWARLPHLISRTTLPGAEVLQAAAAADAFRSHEPI
jgi:hypothetical protein